MKRFDVAAAWTGLGDLQLVTQTAHRSSRRAQAAGVGMSSALAAVGGLLIEARDNSAAGAAGRRKRKAVQETAQVAAALGVAIGLATCPLSSGLQVQGLVEEVSFGEDDASDSASATATLTLGGAGL